MHDAGDAVGAARGANAAVSPAHHLRRSLIDVRHPSGRSALTLPAESNQPPFTVRFEIGTEDLVDYLRLAQKNLNNIGIAAGTAGVIYGVYLAWTSDFGPGALLAAMGAFLILVSATRFADRLRARS